MFIDILSSSIQFIDYSFVQLLSRLIAIAYLLTVNQPSTTYNLMLL
jgi:hypothetical protein